MSPLRKRQKRIGAPEEDDSDLPTPHSQANAPSSVAWSQREFPHHYPLPLAVYSMRSFAHNLRKLSSQPIIWEHVRQELKELPSALVPQLFGILRDVCPNILNHAFITAYLLRGSTIILTDDLPGVNKFTVSAIGSSIDHEQLVELQLRKLEKLPDDLIASTINGLPSLKVLNLRECIKVSVKTVEAVAKTCHHLTVLNLSYTAVTPVSLAPLLIGCKELEVLKLAGIPNWTDATIGKLWAVLGIPDGSNFQSPSLRTLKLRQTLLTDAAVNTALTVFPNVRRLDLSFTAVRHPTLLLNNTILEKLSLTSTRVSSADLLKIISGLKDLRTLALGALGRGASSVAGISNSTAMIMTDETLRKLTALLAQCEAIENVSLVGNTKLGVVSRTGLAEFIRQVGRRCKTLNLSGIPSLRSSDLEGLLAEEIDQPRSPLHSLILNNTGIDDTAAPYIASCDSLRVLEVGGTKLTYAGLYAIIDACTHLEQLNLTSCRGVDVAHRRRFFEVYEEEHNAQEDD